MPMPLSFTLNQEIIVRIFRADSDLSVLRSVLECIGEQVEQDLLQFVLIEPGFQFFNIAVNGKMDILLFGHIGERMTDVFAESHDIVEAGMQYKLLYFHLSKIQQLVDQLQQAVLHCGE